MVGKNLNKGVGYLWWDNGWASDVISCLPQTANLGFAIIGDDRKLEVIKKSLGETIL